MRPSGPTNNIRRVQNKAETALMNALIPPHWATQITYISEAIRPHYIFFGTLWWNWAVDLCSLRCPVGCHKVAQHCSFCWFVTRLLLYPYDFICEALWSHKQHHKGIVTKLDQNSRNCTDERPYGSTLGTTNNRAWRPSSTTRFQKIYIVRPYGLHNRVNHI